MDGNNVGGGLGEGGDWVEPNTANVSVEELDEEPGRGEPHFDFNALPEA